MTAADFRGEVPTAWPSGTPTVWHTHGLALTPSPPARYPQRTSRAAPRVAAGLAARVRPGRFLKMMTKETVEATLDERIRPAIMMDGGNIEVVEVKENTVFVRLLGACGTCPSSQITLRMGVERVLREKFPEMDDLISL